MALLTDCGATARFPHAASGRRRAMAPLDRFLRTGRLLRLRDSLPETEITLLDVLENLNNGTYATVSDFAADVERLNDAWRATDVEALTASLDLTYPADYLLAENWERLRRAFYFIDNLNAGADTVKTFAAATMTRCSCQNAQRTAALQVRRQRLG